MSHYELQEIEHSVVVGTKKELFDRAPLYIKIVTELIARLI